MLRRFRRCGRSIRFTPFRRPAVVVDLRCQKVCNGIICSWCTQQLLLFDSLFDGANIVVSEHVALHIYSNSCQNIMELALLEIEQMSKEALLTNCCFTITKLFVVVNCCAHACMCVCVYVCMCVCVYVCMCMCV